MERWLSWSKAHDWKSCNVSKAFWGSNPHLSARNPKPYQGKEAISDTATEIRHLRNLEVSVLGVFAGEEKDLATEKKIFGKDFAYIRDIKNFSKIVGRYLTKQLEIDG